MPTISGFSFGEDINGNLIPKAGKEIKKHRLDILKKNPIKTNFFNFKMKKCRNRLNKKQLTEELKLYEQFWLSVF